MKLKTNLFTALLFALLFCLPVQAEQDRTDPYQLVEDVSERMFSMLKEQRPQIIADPDILKGMIDTELMPYIDYKYAAYKVLGAQLKNTTKEEREAFALAFRDYLVTTYAQVMTQYDQQGIELAPRKTIGADDKIHTVRLYILEPGKPKINLDFQARKLKNGDWAAFDLIVEGVSLLSSKQAELAPMIRQDGVASVTRLLDEKARQPITMEKTGS